MVRPSVRAELNGIASLEFCFYSLSFFLSYKSNIIEKIYLNTV